MVDGVVVDCSTGIANVVTLTPEEVTQIHAQEPPHADFLGFVGLFTSTEQSAIAAAAVSDPQLMLYCLAAAGAPGGVIWLDDDRVVSGVAYLVTKGVITSDRAAQVLAGTPPPT